MANEVSAAEIEKFKVVRAAEKVALSGVEELADELAAKVGPTNRLVSALRSIGTRYK